MVSKYLYRIKRFYKTIMNPFAIKQAKSKLLSNYHKNLLDNNDMSTLQPLNIGIDEIHTQNECDYYTNNSDSIYNIDCFHMKLYIDDEKIIPYYGDTDTFIDFLKNVETIKYFKYNTIIMIHNNKKINSIFLNYRNTLLSQNLYVQLSKCELYIYQYYQSKKIQIKNKVIDDLYKEENINEKNEYLF